MQNKTFFRESLTAKKGEKSILLLSYPISENQPFLFLRGH